MDLLLETPFSLFPAILLELCYRISIRSWAFSRKRQIRAESGSLKGALKKCNVKSLSDDTKLSIIVTQL